MVAPSPLAGCSACAGNVVLVKVIRRYFPRRHGRDPALLFNRQVRGVGAGPATPTSERERSLITEPEALRSWPRLVNFRLSLNQPAKAHPLSGERVAYDNTSSSR